MDYWNNPYFAFIPTFADINHDGYLDIVATQTENQEVFGIGIKEHNSIDLNGFPILKNIVFRVNSIDDIDRDGNYEILFASNYNLYWAWDLGLYVLG